MFKKTVMFCVLILLLSLIIQSTAIAQSRINLPNDFGFELMGKCVFYSFSYQRMFGNPLGLEVGLSAWGFGSDVIIFIPVGAKLYLIPKDASFYFAGGAVVVTNPVESGPFSDESMTYGYAGIGFEYRSNSGFLFRGTAYGLIAEGSFLIWPGLYVGYAF